MFQASVVILRHIFLETPHRALSQTGILLSPYRTLMKLWRVLQVSVWLSNLHTHRVIDNHRGKWLTATCVFLRSFEDLQSATTYFLVGLPVVDILTAATQEPAYATCFIMMYARHPDTRYTCPKLLSVGQTISIASMNCSFLIVLAFTFTQYVVVISPLNYAQNVTKRRVIICV